MKKNNPKISIVIPCYNCEKYIDECINSINNQTYKNYEIICVNDGSTDNSLRMLKKHKDIIVVNKNNEGAYKARYDGIKKATGDYICVIDSDDVISNNYLEVLLKAITKNNSDIAVCGYRRIDEITGKSYSVEMNKRNDTITISKDYGELLSINTSLWNKLYKSSVLKNILDFDKPPIAMDDVIVNEIAYLYSNKITFVKDILYSYKVRSTSVVNTLKPSVIDTCKDCIVEVRKKFGAKKEMLNVYDVMCFLHFGISLLYRLSNEPKKDFKKLYEDNKSFLDANCPLWRKSDYIKLGYVFKSKYKSLKLYISSKFYKFNMFYFFMVLYKSVIKILKIDIKW